MRTSLDCLSCIVRQAVDASRLVTTDEATIVAIMRTVFTRLAQANLTATPPEIVQQVQAIIRKKLNNTDPFRDIKRKSTEKALSLESDINAEISRSPTPFATAIAFAIAGNILDFGMKTAWDEDHILASFAQARHKARTFPRESLDRLEQELRAARNVLVLGDNAGESVFDRLLIERFPGTARVFYAVKSAPVINDVTMLEALESGLDSVATLLPNGADIPGTALAQCTPEFLNIFHSADVVIAKGQGNFETLNETPRKLWFLFQVKCPVIARHYAYTVGDWMLLEHPGVDEFGHPKA